MGCSKSREKVISLCTPSQLLGMQGTLIRRQTRSFTDEYQIGNKIGTGGFAEVRRCTHKPTGTLRAVKIYTKTQFPADYLSAGGLQHEIDILRRIDHPNVVKVYEYFEDEKCFYIAMEFCMGGELFDKIGDIQNLTEVSVCDIMRQLFSVIAHLHSKKIAHRDIKPENILLEDSKGEIHLKLADFGNALLMRDGEKMKGETGTCYYMAPEVIDEEYTEKCDVWSCGVIMFMLLSGNPPFQGNSDEEIMKNVKAQLYSMAGPEFAKITEEAKCLISKILVPEETRISAIDVLMDPWFRQNPVKKTVRRATISSVNSNLKAFKSSIQLKEAVTTFITSQILSNKDTKPIREVFTLIDSDNDGRISEKDLIDYYRAHISEDNAEEEARTIMEQLDNDGKGYVEYSQYLRAGLDADLVLSRNNLVMAFNMLDSEKEGFITAEKLMNALSAEKNDIENWKAAIIEAGKRGEGTINLQQFIELFLYKS